MEKLKDIPFFFIVGRPRSGTTLLRTLFDAHPDVCIPPECKFILDLYPKYGKTKHWDQDKLEEFLSDLIVQWRFDTWKLDPDVLKNALLTCEGEVSYAEICKVVYASYKSFFNKNEIVVFGDKNPGYTIYTERLLEIFPNARFIHITRDYRDNFISIKNVDFELPIISTTVTKWKYFVKKFNRAMAKRPGAYTVIRFEDLVTEPEKHFKILCDFIRISYSAEVFDFYKKKDEVFKHYPPAFILKYHKSLLEKIDTSKVGQWKTQLEERKIKIADVTAGKYADIAGYERKYRKFDPGIYLAAMPGILFARLLQGMTIVVDRFPYKMRMIILNKGPLFLAGLFLRIFNPSKFKELKSMK